MLSESELEPKPDTPRTPLTGKQKLVIAGLLALQLLASVIFYPLAAVIALTGIGVPVSLVLVSIGSMPASMAMNRKATWQSSH